MIVRKNVNHYVMVRGYGMRRIRYSGDGIEEVLSSIFNPVVRGVRYLSDNKEAVKQAIDTAGSAITVGKNAKHIVDEIRKNKDNDPAIHDLINKIKAIKVGHGFSYI